MWYHHAVDRFASVELGANDSGRRLDRVARKVFPSLPLSRVYAAIRSGDIRLNGKRADGGTRVAAGDRLMFAHRLGAGTQASDRGETPAGRGTPARVDRADDPLAERVVYESPHLLVIAKERGELVHGRHSLEELVRIRLGDSRADGVSFAPGPVNRLDRNTTGLVVFAASLAGAQEMSAALRRRQVSKKYVAVLSGVTEQPQRWATSLARNGETRRSYQDGGGRSALTLVTPVAVSRAGSALHGAGSAKVGPGATARDAAASGATLAIVQIVTGRSHQIRAHASGHGFPLLGDRKYGGPPFRGGYILHAGSLSIPAPTPVLEFAHLWTPLPAAAEERVRRLFGPEAVRQLNRNLSVPDGD